MGGVQRALGTIEVDSGRTGRVGGVGGDRSRWGGGCLFWKSSTVSVFRIVLQHTCFGFVVCRISMFSLCSEILLR